MSRLKRLRVQDIPASRIILDDKAANKHFLITGNIPLRTQASQYQWACGVCKEPDEHTDACTETRRDALASTIQIRRDVVRAAKLAKFGFSAALRQVSRAAEESTDAHVGERVDKHVNLMVASRRANNVADGKDNTPTHKARRRQNMRQYPDGRDKDAIGSTLFSKECTETPCEAPASAMQTRRGKVHADKLARLGFSAALREVSRASTVHRSEAGPADPVHCTEEESTDADVGERFDEHLNLAGATRDLRSNRITRQRPSRRANNVADVEGITPTRKARRRQNLYQYPDGYDKSAAGSTMFCIARGGGKRCHYPEGCGKSAIGSTMFCLAHGGGKRCQFPEGCGKSAIGSTMLCAAHGGGKRCQYPEGCDKGAVGSMFCKAHGGGKRCQYPEGCDKTAQGSTMFCNTHGGGKRCQYPDGCDKGSQGSTVFCAAHGGGKRCQYPDGCDKGAVGSMFCKAHGGGKRCQYPDGCDKSAQGSTMFCIAHWGGKRCQFPERCDKSAIGSTLMCIAHGGGKRCRYPEGCDKSAIGSTLMCIAHGGGKRCQ
jgi:hypothetical protein